MAAYSVISGSQPLSYLNDASVWRVCTLDVLRIEPGSKYALSRNTSTVLSETPESSPPNTPAMHIGPSALAMTMSRSFRQRSTPSRVRIFSPSCALRTMTLPPLTFAASNVWSGWPSSNSTKLDTSTILSTGLEPMERSFF